jgi:hypothetical protein
MKQSNLVIIIVTAIVIAGLEIFHKDVPLTLKERHVLESVVLMFGLLVIGYKDKGLREAFRKRSKEKEIPEGDNAKKPSKDN